MKHSLIIAVALTVIFMGCYEMNKYGKPPALVAVAFNYNPATINHFDYRLWTKEGVLLADVKDKRMLDGQANYVPLNLEDGKCYKLEIKVKDNIRKLDFCPTAGPGGSIAVESDGSALSYYH